MTIEKLLKVMHLYKIPNDVTIMSDSGWECDPTDMDGIWYSSATNTLIFKQGASEFEDQRNFVCLYSKAIEDALVGCTINDIFRPGDRDYAKYRQMYKVYFNKAYGKEAEK